MKVYSKYILPYYFVLMTVPVMTVEQFQDPQSMQDLMIDFYAIDQHDLMCQIVGKNSQHESYQSDIYNAKKLTRKYIKFVKKIVHNIFYLQVYKLSQFQIKLSQANYDRCLEQEYTKIKLEKLDFLGFIRIICLGETKEQFMNRNLKTIDQIMARIIESNLESIEHVNLYIPQ